jgi:hypothetical protein
MDIFDLSSESTENIIDRYEAIRLRNSAAARVLRTEIEIRAEEHKLINGAIPLTHKGISYQVDVYGYLYRTVLRWRTNAA